MTRKKNNNHSYLKVGDQVKIIAGQHKGKIGKIVVIDTKNLLAQIDSIEDKLRYYSKQEQEKLKARLGVYLISYNERGIANPMESVFKTSKSSDSTGR